MNTNWHELKENIYFEDGSLRDIYVFDTNLENWKKWVDFVNKNYEVEFFNGETEQKSSAIDFSVIERFWFEKDKCVNRSTIKIGEININCHFFKIDEFENDISAKEFNSIKDHELLIDYMRNISRIFDKKVFLTWEGAPEFILVEVSKSEILMKYEK